jgi:hypothetical protein
MESKDLHSLSSTNRSNGDTTSRGMSTRRDYSKEKQSEAYEINFDENVDKAILTLSQAFKAFKPQLRKKLDKSRKRKRNKLENLKSKFQTMLESEGYTLSDFTETLKNDTLNEETDSQEFESELSFERRRKQLKQRNRQRSSSRRTSKRTKPEELAENSFKRRRKTKKPMPDSETTSLTTENSSMLKQPLKHQSSQMPEIVQEEEQIALGQTYDSSIKIEDATPKKRRRRVRKRSGSRSRSRTFERMYKGLASHPVPKREIRTITKKNYQNSSQVKLKRNKEEWLKQRRECLRRRKEYDKVRFC